METHTKAIVALKNILGNVNQDWQPSRPKNVITSDALCNYGEDISGEGTLEFLTAASETPHRVSVAYKLHRCKKIDEQGENACFTAYDVQDNILCTYEARVTRVQAPATGRFYQFVLLGQLGWQYDVHVINQMHTVSSSGAGKR